MATLQELLSNFGLGEEAQEKVASENTEEALLQNLMEESGQEKTGAEDMSLADLYMQLASQDEVVSPEADEMDKVAEAAAEEEITTEKIAAEYDAAGRIMARGFFDEFSKLARELEEASHASQDSVGERGTSWQMETNYAEGGNIDTKGSKEQHKNILEGKAEGPAGKAQGAMGPQFATAQHLVTGRKLNG